MIILGETTGAYYREHIVVHPGTRRSRAPCDRDTVTVSCAGQTTGAYYRGNTYAVHPGTCRSRGPCDMLVVKAYILCVSLGGLLGQFVGGTHTLFTPRHAAPEHPVIEILSQYIVLKEVVPYKAYCSPD